MQNHQSSLTRKTKLLNVWPNLDPWQRQLILYQAYWWMIPPLKPPIAFALRAAFAVFTMLLFLPADPMSIPTAVGGGLAFALITH